MFIELVDVLRCPRAHDKFCLVLAGRRVHDRDVMDGTLGCPVCKAEYPILDGVAHFDGGTPRSTATGAAPSEEDALWLAALLDLADPRGFAVLVGGMSAYGPLIATMTDVQLLLVDPPAGIHMGLGLSGLTMPAGAAVFPLASGSARAVALDSSASGEQVDAAVDVLRGGGRLVAPAPLELPEGLTELARDDRVWVAERTAASPVVQLSRKR